MKRYPNYHIYVDKKNLIIIYFNPFPLTPRTKIFEGNLRYLFAKLPIKTNFITTPAIQFTPEELRKINLQKNMKGFVNGINNKYIQIQKEIVRANENISTAEKSLITYHQEIITKTVQSTAMKNLIEDFEKGFEEKINELTKLPFLKSVELVNEGIKLDYGDILIDDIYIGNFYCVITPTEMKFYNIDKTRIFNNHQHPHISDNNPCFGSGSNKAYELLGRMDFKQLAFFIGQFLRTYSKGNPYENISSWIKVNKVNNPVVQTQLITQ